jgi:hypothetical protein
VLGHLVRQSHILVGADLWNYYDCSNLLHEWIIRRTNTVEVAGNLNSKITHAYEPFEHILRQDICVPGLLEVV